MLILVKKVALFGNILQNIKVTAVKLMVLVKSDKRIKCSTGSASCLFGHLKSCDPKYGKDAEVERIDKRRKLNDLKAENNEINSQTKIDDMFSMFTLQFNNCNPKAKAIT